MTSPSSEPNSLRILVADDDPVNQRLYSLVLGRSGHSALVVGDGLDALEALERAPFDLVLLDMSMPGLDGPETARRIRRGEAGFHSARLPIVAITGFSCPEDHQSCLDAGMNGVLVKPLSMSALEPWLSPGGER